MNKEIVFCVQVYSIYLLFVQHDDQGLEQRNVEVVSSERQNEVIEFLRGFVAVHNDRSSVQRLLNHLFSCICTTSLSAVI